MQLPEKILRGPPRDVLVRPAMDGVTLGARVSWGPVAVDRFTPLFALLVKVTALILGREWDPREETDLLLCGRALVRGRRRRRRPEALVLAVLLVLVLTLP